MNPWRSNSGLAASLASTVRRFAPRACASLVKLDQRAARALAGEFGIDEQHVDLVCAFEAGEAGDRAIDHGKQGQGLGEPGAENLLVIGARRPGLTLLLAVISAASSSMLDRKISAPLHDPQEDRGVATMAVIASSPR